MKNRKFVFPIVFHICFLLTACKSTQTVIYQLGNSATRYRLEIPKGFTIEGISGDHEFEKRYWYSDSSVIYITTFSNTLNYDLIREQGTYYQRFDVIHSHDTITLLGQNSSGLFWKDKKLEFITVGYANVPPGRKEAFDKAIGSIR